MGDEENWPRLSVWLEFEYTRITSKKVALSDPENSIEAKPLPTLTTLKFIGVNGADLAPIFSLSAFHNSSYPSSYPNAQIPTPPNFFDITKSYLFDNDRLSSYHVWNQLGFWYLYQGVWESESQSLPYDKAFDSAVEKITAVPSLVVLAPLSPLLDGHSYP